MIKNLTVETLGSGNSPVSQNDCACPTPSVASLELGLRTKTNGDCACPTPTTVSLESGVRVTANSDCACPNPLVENAEVISLPKNEIGFAGTLRSDQNCACPTPAQSELSQAVLQKGSRRQGEIRVRVVTPTL